MQTVEHSNDTHIFANASCILRSARPLWARALQIGQSITLQLSLLPILFFQSIDHTHRCGVGASLVRTQRRTLHPFLAVATLMRARAISGENTVPVRILKISLGINWMATSWLLSESNKKRKTPPSVTKHEYIICPTYNINTNTQMSLTALQTHLASSGLHTRFEQGPCKLEIDLIN